MYSLFNVLNMNTKVVNSTFIEQNKSGVVYLDTLAQLSTQVYNGLNDNQLQQKLNLQKRARAKAFTNSFIFDLIDLKSPLLKSYWDTTRCTSIVLQEGKKITSRYCKQRWCLTCNRIRTAKMINGYKEPLAELKEPQFVTLTIPNVKAKYLKSTIEDMNTSLKAIRKNLKKTYKIELKGLRKYECTYNSKENSYHPHFHLIVESKEASNKLIDLWLNKYPKASRKAQDLRPASEESIIELCKYFTKVISKDNDYNPKALDIMFRSAKGKRTFQPIGIKKTVSEDIEEIASQEIDFKEPQTEIWQYEKQYFDWVSSQGETLSEYKPTKEDYKVITQDYKTKQNDTIKKRTKGLSEVTRKLKVN